MSVEISDHLSREYVVQCLSELTSGGTLLKAGRAVSRWAELASSSMHAAQCSQLKTICALLKYLSCLS